MTSEDERYLRDLEAAAAALRAFPDDYRVLRELLRSLPPGTAPSLREAAAAVLADSAGAGGLDTTGLTLQSNQPIGVQSGGSLGILPELFYGRSNLLTDPTFMQVETINPVPAAPAPTNLVEWQLHHVLNSGVAPSLHQLEQGKTRFTNGNPANSAEMSLFLTTFSAACDISYIYRARDNAGTFVDAPFMLASTRIVDPGALPGNLAGITSVTVTMELVTAAGTILATSVPFDWLRFVTAGAQNDSERIVAILNNPANVDIHWQLRVRVVTPGATTSWIKVNFSEPQMTWAAVQNPPPYSPVVGPWHPEALTAILAGTGQLDPLRFGQAGEAFYRFLATTLGEMRWGPGTATQDARLQRIGAKDLSFDDNAGGPVRMKHVGPHFVQGPTALDLAISYGADGPTNVSRDDEGVPVSSSVISYAAGKVSSVVTTRFGKTITVIPTFTGANITAIARDVT